MTRLRQNLIDLMLTPGLSGHEERVAAAIRKRLPTGLKTRTDGLGNLIATIPGSPNAPSVMLFTHMDQLGFVVRKVEADGLIRVERLGGVSERALAAQAVLLCTANGDVPGIIMNKAHHATTADEKYKVIPAAELHIDTGHGSKAAVHADGIQIGTAVIFRPQALPLAGSRIAGTAIDDRAGCAVLIEIAHALVAQNFGPTTHLVWSVQEEFNLRGAVVAAQNLHPDIALQIDLMLAADTPDMAERGEMMLGGGPGISLYSFHGRGTLNGVIPHPALVRLFESAADAAGIPLQRSAQTGVLTDLSYVQLMGDGVASLDIGFPMRHSHSALECCDIKDLEALTTLTLAALKNITAAFSLSREG